MELRETISAEEINLLPQFEYKGHIQMIECGSDLDHIINSIDSGTVVGFDTETKPSFLKGEKNKVAIVQIATPQVVYLIKIQKTGLTKSFIDFLENEEIIKVGVAIFNDLRELKSYSPFKPAAVIDLPDMAEKKGIQARGLRNLAAILLEVRISKSAKISNWEAIQLSRKQCIYAATDAWVCREMYIKLQDLC
jgi:ribonuclease D